MGDWEQRQLCPDGGCTGVIGNDGTCKVCGRAAPGWGDERTRGMRDVEQDEPAPDDAPIAAAPTDPKAEITAGDPDDFEQRALCRDGSCIGVIGDDGRCRVCGLEGEPAELG